MQTGFIVSTADGRAEVDAALGGPCGECEEKGACALHLGGSTTQTRRVTVDNPIGAHPGDLVEISLPGHAELEISLLVWIVPFVCLVIGAFLGAQVLGASLGSEDLAALLGAVTGFVASFLVLRRVDAQFERKQDVRPYVAKVLEPCRSAERGVEVTRPEIS